MNHSVWFCSFSYCTIHSLYIGIGDGFLTPRCDHTLHWNWESKALMVEAPVCLLQRGVGQGGPTAICVFFLSRNIHWEGPGLVVWDSFWLTWHTSQDATKEAVVLSFCVFCNHFRFADLAMICLVHDVFANSFSLFASEFSTGHHAFDDIPLRKAGLTSGVSHLGASTMEIIFLTLVWVILLFMDCL